VITFSGVNTALQVQAVSTPVILGEFHTFPSGGFTFDKPLIPTLADILSFNLSLVQTLPVADLHIAHWDYGPTGDQRARTNQLDTAIGPQPPGFVYQGIGFRIENWPLDLPSSGDLAIEAAVGLVPEPSTLLLVGTTAVGLGLARWRQRRQG
jgi:hypothetical protein